MRCIINSMKIKFTPFIIVHNSSVMHIIPRRKKYKDRGLDENVLRNDNCDNFLYNRGSMNVGYNVYAAKVTHLNHIMWNIYQGSHS